jgi:hypothetical protein
MTVFEEPPIVDLHEILDEQEAEAARISRTQLLLVVGGGIVGVVGLLAVLVAAAPALIDLVGWITSLQKAANG